MKVEGLYLYLLLIVSCFYLTSSDQRQGTYQQGTTGVPKVALLFLVRDQIPTEPVWESFLLAAAELQLKAHPPPLEQPAPINWFPPRSVDESIANRDCYDEVPTFQSRKLLQGHATGQEDAGWSAAWFEHLFDSRQSHWRRNVTQAAAHWLSAKCGAAINGTRVYETQSLFSVYVHRAPHAAGAPLGSIFFGRDIPQRTHTGHAQPSLVTAQRLLFVDALKDPLNTKFLLLSESCVPLYHPALVWAQLVVEGGRSRVGNDDAESYRWTDAMATPHFLQEHFRKSSQFTALSRRHAEIVVGDEHLFPQFQMHCRSYLPLCSNREATHMCFTDEHYIPSLLNIFNETLATDQIGHATFADWSSLAVGGWSPHAFEAHELHSAGIQRLRTAGDAQATGCSWESTRKHAQQAAALFHRTPMCHIKRIAPLTALQIEGLVLGDGDAANLTSNPHDDMLWRHGEALVESIVRALQQHGGLEGFEPMNMFCPLFARKITPQAAPFLASRAWDCDGLGFAWDCIAAG